MLFKHNFQINDDVVTKKHLISFYNYDNKCNLRLAPNLTYAHIYPGQFEKVRVYLATQVFSGTVAAGISIDLVFVMLPPCAQFIIDFISDIDKLFDIFNFSDIPNRNDFNRPFKNTETQINHLNEMEEVFKQLQYVIHKYNGTDESNRMNLINGWLNSIVILKTL
ncbi:THAP-type domain-containing protein [Aphis craccivora]|uniref:THAP-type domain-containing protein n=1 Tax=Aphis craccivora TaxID=307492 RepID=A0A6G0VYT4_APHCR|nr:THAP-type domain-containing protein [Aphis craccivora]